MPTAYDIILWHSEKVVRYFKTLEPERVKKAYENDPIRVEVIETQDSRIVY